MSEWVAFRAVACPEAAGGPVAARRMLNDSNDHGSGVGTLPSTSGKGTPLLEHSQA